MEQVYNNKTICDCGKAHTSSLDDYLIAEGALSALPDYVRKYGATKAFLLADVNTFPLAGDRVMKLLEENGIRCMPFVFQSACLEPDEHTVGSAFMHYDTTCDIVITLGSGVLNDIGKIVSKIAAVPYIVLATAPSMDGYASASSSMSRSGVKVSLPSACPNVVIGDLDIIKNAPLHMLKSGLGDMLAKYVSICEWRIANLICDEYYCPQVADYIRRALARCVDAAPGLIERKAESVKAVFEGLIACGCAMEYASLSRPASGVEHYFSHIWDMRALAFGTEADLHGIQCAIGTRYALLAYEQIRATKPDINKAQQFAQAFDTDEWFKKLEAFVGPGAKAMIALEEKEQKYNVSAHKQRLMRICQNWDAILTIMDEELPSLEEFDALLDALQMPKTLSEIRLDESTLPMTFKASKDIRDKYVLSRLAWDLGVIDEIAF